jgi:hypothetical protein
VLALFDSGNTGHTPVDVSADTNGDVQLSFDHTTVVLEGVHNAGWQQVQDLTNAGFHIQNT